MQPQGDNAKGACSVQTGLEKVNQFVREKAPFKVVFQFVRGVCLLEKAPFKVVVWFVFCSLELLSVCLFIFCRRGYDDLGDHHIDCGDLT